MENLGGGIYAFTSDTHKFTTDTVLLSDFTSPVDNLNVMELCSGSGVLSLLWFRNENPKHVTTLEIQKDACKLLKKSVSYNELEDKFTIINDDINKFNDNNLHNSFDIIACNPPYKEVNKGKLNNTIERQLINHEIACSINSIAKFSSKYLKHGGRLCVCLRPDRLVDVMNAMRANNIEPKKMRFVHFSLNKQSKLVMIEGKKGGKPYLNILQPLILKKEDLISNSFEIDRIYKLMKEEKR